MKFRLRRVERSASLGPGYLGLLVIAAILPWTVSSYWIYQATLVLIWAMTAVGLALQMGYCGQISIASNAQFAVGAYTAGLLSARVGIGMYVAIICGMVAGGLLGLILSGITARLRGLYLATATLAVAIVVPQVVIKFDSITGGDSGLTVEAPMVPQGLHLPTGGWIYYVVLAFACVLFWICGNLVRGPLGRAFAATRDEELVARGLGVNTTRVKAGVGVLAGISAGLAGSLYIFVVGIMAPQTVGVLFSVSILVGVIVGGMRTVLGAVVAGVFIEFAPQATSAVSASLGGVIYGVILIASMFVLPRGLLGLGSDAGTWMANIRRKSAGARRQGKSGDSPPQMTGGDVGTLYETKVETYGG